MKSDDSRHDPPLSETDIQAYADGLLTPERAAHLRHYLGKRPGEARRVAFYGKLNQQIQHAFQPTDEPSPVPAATSGFIHTAAGRWLTRRMQMIRLHPLRAMLALALMLALAMVATSGWMAASQVSQDALDNAAVMALAQAAGEDFGAKMAPTVGSPAADPVAPNLVPVGMHLVSHRTLNLGALARATEYVYLNARVSRSCCWSRPPCRPQRPSHSGAPGGLARFGCSAGRPGSNVMCSLAPLTHTA